MLRLVPHVLEQVVINIQSQLPAVTQLRTDCLCVDLLRLLYLV